MQNDDNTKGHIKRWLMHLNHFLTISQQKWSIGNYGFLISLVKVFKIRLYF